MVTAVITDWIMDFLTRHPDGWGVQFRTDTTFNTPHVTVDIWALRPSGERVFNSSVTAVPRGVDTRHLRTALDIQEQQIIKVL